MLVDWCVAKCLYYSLVRLSWDRYSTGKVSCLLLGFSLLHLAGWCIKLIDVKIIAVEDPKPYKTSTGMKIISIKTQEWESSQLMLILSQKYNWIDRFYIKRMLFFIDFFGLFIFVSLRTNLLFYTNTPHIHTVVVIGNNELFLTFTSYWLITASTQQFQFLIRMLFCLHLHK